MELIEVIAVICAVASVFIFSYGFYLLGKPRRRSSSERAHHASACLREELSKFHGMMRKDFPSALDQLVDRMTRNGKRSRDGS